MNFDTTQIQVWLQQFIDAIRSGNLAAIGVALLAGWVLWKKLRSTPATPAPVPTTGAKTVDAALHLLNAEAETPAEKALTKAVADKFGGK